VMLNLAADKEITSTRITQVPVTDSVIRTVEELAAQGGMTPLKIENHTRTMICNTEKKTSKRVVQGFFLPRCQIFWKNCATTLEVDPFDRFVNLLEKCFGPESKNGNAGMDVLAADADFALSICRRHPMPSSTRKGIEDINLVNFRDCTQQSFKSSGMLSPEHCCHKTRRSLAQTLPQGHLLPSWQNSFQFDAQR